MKKTNLLYLFGAFFFLVMLSLASCSKEGPAGKDGANGVDGADGTANCVACHDADASLSAKQYQWENSMHNAGSAITRNSIPSCSPCHSNQGFHLSDGNVLGAGIPINDPTTINCYTCHPIHSTFTQDDLGLLFTDVPEWHVTYGKTVDADFGKGNLCAHCHQSRTREPVVDMNDLTQEYTDISSHYGPHYSSQANLSGGFGAYEFVGTVNYGDGTHVHGTDAEDGCVSCHMRFSTAGGSGGHNMHIDHGSDLEKACAQCHNDGAGAEEKYDEYYDENFRTINEDGTLNETSRYTLLGDMLVEKGVYSKVVDSVGGVPDAVHYDINPDLTINGTLTAAMFNHRYLYQDHSHGMHNPGYAKALLQNSIEAVEALTE